MFICHRPPYAHTAKVLTRNETVAAKVNSRWNGQFSCYDLVAKTPARAKTIVQVGDIAIGGDEFVVMAGPCAVESEQQLLDTAESVAPAGARILRGGAYKPRSSPYSFQGLGVEGLKLLSKAREATGIGHHDRSNVSETDVEVIAEYADIMQVGTRSMENFSLLERLGQVRPSRALEAGNDCHVGRLAALGASHRDARESRRNPVRARNPDLRDRDPKYL